MTIQQYLVSSEGHALSITSKIKEFCSRMQFTSRKQSWKCCRVGFPGGHEVCSTAHLPSLSRPSNVPLHSSNSAALPSFGGKALAPLCSGGWDTLSAPASRKRR